MLLVTGIAAGCGASSLPGTDLDTDTSEFTGTIELVGENALVIDGQEIILDSSVDLPEGLEAGDIVEVTVEVQEDGTLVLISIEVDAEADATAKDNDLDNEDDDDEDENLNENEDVEDDER
jgi:hypothetical protein